MKKLLQMKTMLLLCALIVGSGSVLAATSTVTASRVTSSSASWTGSASETWNVTVNGGATNQNVTSGYAQIGTKNSPSTSVTFSTSGISGTITSIVVDCASYNGVATISATVGGSDFGTQSQATPTWSDSRGGNVTFSGSNSGAIVVTMTNGSGGRAMYINKITVTYSASSKSPHELAWSAASKSITYSETPYNLPTLTNPHNLPIEYSSTNTSVAEINSSTGEITVKNENGSTTITATTTGDETYGAGSVSYTLNVTRKAILEDGVFNFSYTTAEGGGYGSGATQGTSSDIVEGSSIWKSGNVKITTGVRYLWCTDGTLRLYRKTNNNDASSITFELIDMPGYVITQIDFTGVTGTGALSNLVEAAGSYSVDGSTARWTGAAPSVTFTSPSNSVYIKTVSVTYTNTFTKEVGSAGWATWVAPYNVEVPTGVTAYYVTASTDSKATLTEVLAIPANEPVLLSGTGNHEFTVCDEDDLDANEVEASANLLEVSDDETTDGVYVLANKTNGVGFYLWAGGLLGAGYVYLPAPSGDAREFISFDSDATGIEKIENATSNMENGIVFNLAGQRVAQPSKGLYIVNGKKIVKK